MLTELAALLDLLRTSGVTRFEGCYGAKASLVKLTLGAVDAKPDDKDAPVADVETCRCGHALYAHINGLCGEGCDVTQCAPPEKP